jgi:hypothetical protein
MAPEYRRFVLSVRDSSLGTKIGYLPDCLAPIGGHRRAIKVELLSMLRSHERKTVTDAGVSRGRNWAAPGAWAFVVTLVILSPLFFWGGTLAKRLLPIRRGLATRRAT